MFCKRTGAVVVATVRALKLHGGAPPVKAGKPLADVYKSEHLDVLKLGTFLSFLLFTFTLCCVVFTSTCCVDILC